jgi:5-methylcytosine-specific restriction endonuclease McrA
VHVNLAMKFCPSCGDFKPLYEFHKDKSKRSGHTSYCKECAAGVGRVYYDEHRMEILSERRLYNQTPYAKERMSKAGKLYRATDKGKAVHSAVEGKRRAIARETETEDLSWYYIAIRESELVSCHICGKQLPGNECHIDHIIPLSRGGTHTLGNLAPACPVCNRTKSNGTLEESTL